MNQPTPRSVDFFERHGQRIAYVLIFLLVATQLLRAGFTRHEPTQLTGHLGLALAYLLIIPCIHPKRMGMVGIMFTYLGLFGGVAMLEPDGAAILGTIGLLTQSGLVVLLLRVAQQRRQLGH